MVTHAGATQEHEDVGIQDAARHHNPREAPEEDLARMCWRQDRLLSVKVRMRGQLAFCLLLSSGTTTPGLVGVVGQLIEEQGFHGVAALSLLRKRHVLYSKETASPPPLC